MAIDNLTHIILRRSKIRSKKRNFNWNNFASLNSLIHPSKLLIKVNGEYKMSRAC